MHAIAVSVNYTDMLAVTLPYNRHHFNQFTIVTSPTDAPNLKEIARKNDARIVSTDLFYADGATFNKWRALEWALDVIGRTGWLCLMDADVLWPKDANLCTCPCHSGGMIHFSSCCEPGHGLSRGKLYTPLRRMWVSAPHNPLPIRSTDMMLGGIRVPGEEHWKEFPVHRNTAEWAGYSQIFHAEDPVLGPAPWHEIDWKHAGGADSFFQMKWPRDRKVRPPFEVLHLGPAGENWFGRATRYLDGKMPEGSAGRAEMIRGIWTGRRANRIRHGPNSDVYRDEKI